MSSMQTTMRELNQNDVLILGVGLWSDLVWNRDAVSYRVVEGWVGLLDNGMPFIVILLLRIAEQSPKDKKIPENLFRGRKDAEKKVERSFCARKSRRKIFLLCLSAERKERLFAL